MLRIGGGFLDRSTTRGVIPARYKVNGNNFIPQKFFKWKQIQPLKYKTPFPATQQRFKQGRSAWASMTLPICLTSKEYANHLHTLIFTIYQHFYVINVVDDDKDIIGNNKNSCRNENFAVWWWDVIGLNWGFWLKLIRPYARSNSWIGEDHGD